MIIATGFIALFAVLTAFSERALRAIEELPRARHISFLQLLMVPSWFAWPLLLVQSKLMHALRLAYRRLF